MRPPERIAGVACATLVSTSCSFVVDELPLRCRQQSDCDAVNAEYGLDLTKDCSVYQCRADGRGCEKRAQDLDGDGYLAAVCRSGSTGDFDCDDREGLGTARAPHKIERCDGKDNDCDDLIDEELFGEAVLIQHTLESGEPLHIDHASTVRSGLMIALTSKNGDRRSTGLWRLDGSRLVRAGSLASDDTRDTNCDEPQGAVHCVFEEVAIGADEELTIGAGINAICPSGQLRIGIDRTFAVGHEGRVAADAVGGSPEINFAWNRETIGRGATQSAMNLVLGVDRDPSSSVGCPSSGEPTGASAPRLAVLPGTDGTAQALALWRAGPPGARAALMGLGLWTRRGLIVDATNGARGEVMQGDDGLGSDRPVVQPWTGATQRGYFVAYDADASIHLAYVSALANAASSTLPAAKVRLSSQDADASHPALTVHRGGGGSDAPRGLALAWRTATEDGTAIQFSKAAFDLGAAGNLSVMSAPLTLTERSLAIVDGPVISYVTSGFASPALAATDRDGGWFVAWVEQDGAEQRLVGVRIAELTGRMIEAPFSLFRGSVEHLFAYTASDLGDGGIAGYGFVRRQSREQESALGALNIGALSCRDL